MGRTQDYIAKSIVSPAVRKEMRSLKRTIAKQIQSGHNQKEKDLNLTESAYGSAVFSDWYDDASVSNGELLERYFGWVYAAIKVIADESANMQLKLMRLLPDGNVEELDSHPALEVLNKVNDIMTFSDIVTLKTIHKKLTGEAYWYLVKDGNQIKQIRPLNPSYVRPVAGDYRKGQSIAYYEVNYPEQGRQIAKKEDVVMFKEPNPTSTIRGFGTLQAALRSANMEVNAEDWNNAFFKNAASTGAVLIFNGKLSPDTRKRLEKSIEAQYQGVSRAHRTFIIDNGGDYKEAGRTQRDMEFIAMQQWVRDKILALFRVSKSVLGIVDDVNRANGEVQDNTFAKRVLVPEFSSFCDTLNEFFLPQFEGTEDMFFDFESPVMEDRAQIATMIQQLTPTVMTINEARSLLNLDPINEEGDVLYVQTSLAPLGTQDSGNTNTNYTNNDQQSKVFIGKVKLSPYKKKITEYQKKQINRIKSSSRYKRMESIRLKTSEVVKEVIKKKKELTNPASESRMNVFWKGMDNDSSTYVKEIRATMRKIFDNDIRQITRKISGSKSPVPEQLQDVVSYLEESKYLKQLIEKDVRDSIFRANKSQGKRAASFLSEKPYAFTRSIQNQLNNFVKKMSTSVQDTRSERVLRVLEDGISKGLSVPEITASIRSLYADFEATKARQIATTEVFRAFNYANQKAWEQNDQVIAKQWFTAADERTCEFCGPQHGKIVSLEQDYFPKGFELEGFAGGVLNLNYEDVGFPPLHPQCRCTVAPITGFFGKTVQPETLFGSAPISKEESDFISNNGITIKQSLEGSNGIAAKYNRETNRITVYEKDAININYSIYHELGHAIDEAATSRLRSATEAADAVTKDANSIILHRVMDTNKLTESEAKQIIKNFSQSGGNSKYFDYISKTNEIFADAYAQYKKSPQTFKNYAPNMYKFFKGLF